MASNKNNDPDSADHIPATAEDYVAQGEGMSDWHIYDAAIVDFRIAMQMDTHLSAPMHVRIGDMLVYKYYSDEALLEYDSAEAADPSFADAYIRIAEIYFPRDSFRLALAQLSKAAKFSPGNKHVYRLMAAVDRKLKNYAAVVKDYTEVIAHSQGDAETYTDRGIARIAVRDYLRSIADFDTAMLLDPKASIPYTYRGIAKEALHDPHGAISDYTIALDRGSRYNEEALSGRISAWMTLRDTDHALIDLDTILVVLPNEGRWHRLRGDIFKARNSYQEAAKDYDRVLNLDGDFADAYYVFGCLDADDTEYEKAIENFDRAIKLNPRSAESYYRRGVAKNAIKQKESACADLTKSKQLGYKNADDMIRKLCK